MKLRVHACLCVLWLGASVPAQVSASDVVTVRSRSGQFTVYGTRMPSSPPRPTGLSTNVSLVPMEPTLLAVSCERIKQALLWQLDAADQWRGKIHLVLHPVQNPDETIVVTSSRFTDGWIYHVQLPDAVEPSRLARAIVRVLLLEWANRNAAERSAEIPLWLSEGLSQQLLATSGLDLVVQTPEPVASGFPLRHTQREERGINPLARAREQLQARSPLMVAELSWPKEEQLAGDAAETYRSSAQLFVHELLRLRNGRACLRAMLGELAQCLNWQTVFLRAFRAHFQRQLDLEKWWALQVVHFTGRNLAGNRPGAESWQKLDEVLRTPVQISGSSNALPQHAELSLQAIIREWDYSRQSKSFRAKIQQLQLLRLRVAQPVAALADDYRLALEAYLLKTEKTGFARPIGTQRPGIRRIVEQTIKQLDALDAKRETLRSSPPIAGQTRSDTASGSQRSPAR